MTDTRKDAMAVLMDKVRTGTAIEADFAEAWPHAHNSEHHRAWLAYLGSLDAAEALHDAVLTGWEYGYDGSIAWVKLPGLRASYRHDSMGGLTSRAWLISILSAMIALAQP
jgi:hypothetical protein